MQENRFELIEALQAAIDAEHTLSVCCTHLSGLIHNGKVKKQFNAFANKAHENKEFLFTYLEILGVKDFSLEAKCQMCKMNPESFSLDGAVNVALEIVETSLKLIKKVISLSKSASDKRMFKKLLVQKNEQKDYLKKEQNFYHHEKNVSGCASEYCIPEVIAKII